MKRNVEIQFKNRHLSNKIGNILFVFIFITSLLYYYAAWFDKWNFKENLLFIIAMLIAVVLAGSLSYYRTYQKAILSFIPEGIIIEAKIGYIPIKYSDIKYFKGNGIPDSEDNTVEFIIQTTNKKSYRIKSKSEIYEGLIQSFPEKNGKYIW